MEELRQQIRLQIKEELEKDFQEELEKRVAHLSDVQKEIERVAAKLEGVAKEIAAMLDDPSVELSKVMRKRTEQAELKSYLDGLRFSIGDQAKAKGASA
jgi:DNA repair exonuclease SbcCD ATPase subunit